MSSSAGDGSRFTHLLQPIRDLSQNWNIDLAQELEEYLDELEHLSIAFDPADDDGGGDGDSVSVGVATRAQQQRQALASQDARVMNFAEAALLIQGTSVIYSRKVEYLYALVFQTLAHLTRQQDTPAAARGAEGSSDDAATGDDDHHGDDAHDVFANPLPVVDELDEARNITLKTVGAETQRQRSGGAAKSNTNIQASISLMGSLIPDERDHGETFKLLSCNLHSSGVLLLDETSKKYLGIASAADDYGDDAVRGFGAARSDPVAALNFDSVADDFFMDGGDDDHHQNDAGDYGDVDYGYNNAGEEDGDQHEADGAATAAEGSHRQVSFAAPATTTSRARHQERDPWAPLDPYDASSATSRPFRKGRSYPKRKKDKKASKKGGDEGDDAVDGLDDPLFQERFLFGASRPQWASWVWSETKENALESKFKSKFCKAPLLVKSCDELWKLETKWKGLLRRREAKEEQSAQAMLLQEQAEEEEEEQMHALNVNMANGVSALDMELNVNDDDGGDDYDDDNGDDGLAFDGGGDWDQGTQDDQLPLSSHYLGTSSERFKDDDDEFTSDPNRQLSYEDICRQHIKSFMQGAEKYVRETNLSKQVNDWQSKLNPILKEQDQHPPFDIHTYGRDIIGHLEQETRVKQEERSQTTPKRKAASIAGSDTEEGDGDETNIPFGDIVGGMSQYQVCRMFLASLQLANNGNVQLVHGHSAVEQSSVPFQMKLLSTSNVYESLQEAA